MESQKFPQANLNLEPGDCPNTIPLVACVATNPEMAGGDPEMPFVISCWKLTKEELEEVNKTGEVYFAIMAPESVPPQFPMVLNPFEHYGFVPMLKKDKKG